MVIANQMQHAVNDKDGYLLLDRVPVLLRLHESLGIGDNHLTEVDSPVRGHYEVGHIRVLFRAHREGKDIGRGIDTEVDQIQFPYPRLAGDYQAEFSLGAGAFSGEYLLNDVLQPVSFEFAFVFIVNENIYFHPRNNSTGRLTMSWYDGSLTKMDRESVVDMLREDTAEWANLVAMLETHPDKSLHDPASPPWNSRDVYAHIARWMEHSNATLEARLASRTLPPIPGTDDEINARWQREDSRLSLAEAREKAQKAFERRKRLIESVPEERWDKELESIARADGVEHIAAHRSYIIVGKA